MDAKLLLSGHSTDSFEYAVIELLLAKAVGRDSALSVPFIKEALKHRFPITERFDRDIQNLVVRPSRKADTSCFICSCRKGYYIPATQEDIDLMEKFYVKRIAQEECHLANLMKFADNAGLLVEKTL